MNLKRFAELMRQGSQKVEQTQWVFCEADETGKIVRACAMGMAMIPLTPEGEDPDRHMIPTLAKVVGLPADYSAWPTFKNPDTGSECDLWDIITDLNNYSEWTPERIATWLETLDETV